MRDDHEGDRRRGQRKRAGQSDRAAVGGLVEGWLVSLGLESRVCDFKREAIDVEALAFMDLEQLQAMGIDKMGDRLKLLGRARQHHTNTATATATASASASADPLFSNPQEGVDEDHSPLMLHAPASGALSRSFSGASLHKCASHAGSTLSRTVSGSDSNPFPTLKRRGSTVDALDRDKDTVVITSAQQRNVLTRTLSTPQTFRNKWSGLPQMSMGLRMAPMYLAGEISVEDSDMVTIITLARVRVRGTVRVSCWRGQA